MVSMCEDADPYEAYRALPAWRRWLQFAWLSCLLVFTIGRVLVWRAVRLAWHYAAWPGLYASLMFGSSYGRWVSVRLARCPSSPGPAPLPTCCMTHDHRVI